MKEEERRSRRWRELEENREGEGGWGKDDGREGGKQMKGLMFTSLVLAGHSIISSSPLSVIL